MPGLEMGMGAISGMGGMFTQMQSASMNRKWQLQDREHMEEYYHPKAQMKRLADAGIPGVALYDSGGASGQSAMPQATTIDPSLGIAEGMQRGMTMEVQRKQLDLMNQEVRTKKAEADIKESERNYLLGREVMENATLHHRQLEIKRQKEITDAWIGKNTAEIGEMEREIKRDIYEKGLITKELDMRIKNMAMDLVSKQIENAKTSQEIKNLEQTWKEMNRAWATNELILRFKRRLIETVDQGGYKSFHSMLKDLFMTLVIGSGNLGAAKY